MADKFEKINYLTQIDDINLLPLSVVQKLEEAGIPQDSLIFYQNDSWVYQIGLKIPDNKEFHRQQLDSLGPFDVHEVDISFHLSPFSSQYTITKIGGQELIGEEQITGVHAPIGQITLEGFARSTANIPDDATHFCWLYPPYSAVEDLKNQFDDSYAVDLLKIGGFAYFSVGNNDPDRLQLIRVNSLVESAGNGLTFEGSYHWRHEFTDTLWKENRFRPVTLPSLRAKGARYFAFINPSESLTTENGEISWIPSPHGAFAYLFNEDHSRNEFDCYFSVADNCLGVSPSDEEQ